MHDPTEGGVMTGLLEMGRGAGVGLEIDLDAIPIATEGAAICRDFGLDPLRTIASGAALVAVAARDALRLVHELTAGGYPTKQIGRVTEEAGGLVARRDDQLVVWPTFAADEITRIFA
jgi:hydrogenase maturation factor